MATKTIFWKHLALFLSGAMFWAAVMHLYLAVNNVETFTFGVKVEDENRWGVVFHLVIACILFWFYKKKS